MTCRTKRCSCEDQGLHTPCPVCNPVDCPAPSLCPEYYYAECVILPDYGIPLLNIEKNDSLAKMLQMIAVFLDNPTCLLKSPANVHPTTITSTAIHLMWEVQGTPTSIEVQYSLDQIAWNANPALAGTATTDVIGNSLTPDTDYYIKVIADDGVDVCESAVIKVKTLSS